MENFTLHQQRQSFLSVLLNKKFLFNEKKKHLNVLKLIHIHDCDYASEYI